MAYRCPQAVIGRAEEPIRCKVSGTVCAHQKMCLMEGRIVLTAGALDCPARDGSLDGRFQNIGRTPPAPPEPGKKTAAEKKPAKKTAARRKAK